MASTNVERRFSTESIVESMGRSHTWSSEVQKTWQQPVRSTETFSERVNRYAEYFKLTPEQLCGVYNNLSAELETGCRLRAERQQRGSLVSSRCSLKTLDTCVDRMPTGQERDTVISLDFQGTTVRALKARLEGSGKITIQEQRTNLRDVQAEFPKGLMDRECGAMQLFDSLANTVKDLIEKTGHNAKKELSVGFGVSFPCDVRNIKSANLVEWTKGFETGRSTADPVEGLDLVTLLDMAFWRKGVNAKVSSVCNDCTATLMACAYEKPSTLPPCTVAVVIGVGLNGAYVEPNAAAYGLKGNIINTEIGGFNKGLPVTDVDLEVDFADQGGAGRQALEKMIAGGYIGEVCRRLVVKVWRDQAPPLAWARQALPTAAAALVVSDSTENLEMAERLFKGLWDWDTNLETRENIKKLFTLVFDRSAGLAAAVIAALAKKSGRLQPAMGGVTVAVDGSLHISNPWYCENLKNYLAQLLGDETAGYVHLYICNDAAGKGSAILAHLMNN